MSLDDLHSSLAFNGSPATEAVDMGPGAGFLGPLVEGAPTGDSELSALLASLDSANDVASGVEAKLDEVLDTLDHLLASLEASHNDKPREAAMPRSESQLGPPEQA